jgi:type VI secretion system secreted protein Hcp
MQNIYWEIDGIKGESTSDQGKDMIELLQYSCGMSMPIDRNGSALGRTIGHVVHSDVSITKYFDLASPVLQEKCCGGDVIKTMKIHVWKADATGKPVEYFTIEFADCIISSVDISGSNDRPTEAVSFNFQKVKWTYNQQDKSKGGKKGSAAAADAPSEAAAASPGA